jgi:CBS domain-containing protein
MTIADIARSEVVSVTPEAGANRIATLMEEESVGSVVVVEDDHPVGLVTDRDLAIEVVSQGRDPTELIAGDVMTPDPITANVDEGVYDVLSRAGEESVRRIPLVDDADELAGIVTLDDFVVLLTSELENVSEVIQAESPPY